MFLLFFYYFTMLSTFLKKQISDNYQVPKKDKFPMTLEHY
jgi:hypothetical protein